MSVTHETIEDIIREKRNTAAKIRAYLSIVPSRREDQLLEADSLDREADRLDAAWKRENELSKLRPKNAANLGQFGNNPNTFGNVAAIRKALEVALKAICNHARANHTCDSLAWENSTINANCGDILCGHRDLCEAKTEIQKALSAPARNCDIQFRDNVARYNAFKDWCKTKGNAMSPELAYDAFEWLLFSPANERGAE